MSAEKYLCRLLWLCVVVEIVDNECMHASNCDVCKRGNGALKCTKCHDGYFINSTGLCQKCQSNCVTCVSLQNCTSCIVGYFGNGCGAKCDMNCVDIACHIIEGACLNGCQNGYFASGQQCRSCSASRQNCEMCTDALHCTKCASGYNVWPHNNTTYCNSGCPPGTWGYQCNYNCSSSCSNSGCNETNGYCNKCSKYKYGEMCQFTCREVCNDGTGTNICDKVTGQCIYGCKPNYTEAFCQIVNGQWSEWSEYGQCNVTCGDNGSMSRTRLCNNPAPQNGGEHCRGSKLETAACNGTSCPDVSSDETTDAISGSEINGALVGGAAGGAVLFVALCVALAVVFTVRRRKQGQKGKDVEEVFFNNGKTATSVANDFESNSNNTFSNSMCSRQASTDHQKEDYVYAKPVKPNEGIRNKSVKILNEEYVYAVPHKGKAKMTDGQRKNKATLDVFQTPPVPCKWHQDMEDDDLEEINDSNISELDTIDGKIPEQSDAYYNTSGLIRRKISVEKLVNIVADKSADEFIKEYQRLTDGLSRDYTIAVVAGNKYRNRYKKIYPYDATRVKLSGGSSDYINASYVDGHQQSKAYIACLGPTEKTTENFTLFWTMVWQQKVEKIVMLTKLMEGEKMKCEQYWPETDSETYGEFTIQRISVVNYAEFSIRNFDIVKDSERRYVYQIHYLAWPDKGVPHDVTSLLEFRHKVVAVPTTLNGPTIVHCSAGIGRTGTYIALDMLIREGTAENSVDVFGCVNGIRGQRVNLVQNVEQYKFIHHALVHELALSSKQLLPKDIACFLIENGRTDLRRQFEQLKTVLERTSDVETESIIRNKDLKTKNRKGADVPGDRNRVKLISKKPGSSDYINATFVNGYVKSNRFIVAQTPLPETLVDFIGLIMQEDIVCIVSMDPDGTQDKTKGIYLPPANQTMKIGIYTVSCTKSETFASYVMRILEVSKRHGRGDQKKVVHHFQPTFWQSHEPVPTDAAKFVRVVSEVDQFSTKTEGNGGTLVHCRNAAERSGLFCVVSILMEKMKYEEKISVLNTVRHLKSIRHLAIPTEKQYIFCHECVVANQDSTENTYTNVDWRA